jgi:glycosyltransferase involved in cell wall biosynthesis
MKVLHVGWSKPSVFCGGLDIHVSNTVQSFSGKVDSSLVYVRDKKNNQDPVRRSFKTAQEAVKQHADADLVHTHDWMGVPTGIKLRSQGAAWVSTVHSLPNQHPELEAAAVSEPDAVTTVSKLLADKVSVKYGSSPDIVRNAFAQMEPAPQSPTEKIGDLSNDKILCVYAGRHSPEKNLKVLIYAFSRFSEENPAHLVITGEGSNTAQLKRLAQMLDVDDQVTFTGFLKRSMVGRCIEEADLFVHPADSEPFGLSISEAVALGTPVVAGESGVFELVDKGYVVVQPKIRQIVAGMEEALGMEPEPMRPRKWEDVASEYEQIYTGILDYPD